MTDQRSTPYTVGLLAPERYPEAEAVLARAFYPDPLFGFFAPDRRKEYLLLPKVFAAFIADSRAFDCIWGATMETAYGNRLVGAAVWQPPGAMPRPMRRELMMQARILGLLLRGKNLSIGIRLLTAVDKVHPKEPHWYLALLGADPALQGKGVGTALIEPVLGKADNEGMPCYLETQKAENIPYYLRHGFEVLHTVSVPGSPTVWGMRRNPR